MPDLSPTLSWLRTRLFPRGTGLILWASYVIILGNMAFFLFSADMERGGWNFAITLLSLVALLALNIVMDDLRLLFRSRTVGVWVLLAVSSVLTYLATWYGALFTTVYILFMLVAQASVMLPLRQALLLSVLITGAWFMELYLMGSQLAELLTSGFGILVGLTFTLTLSQVLFRFAGQTQRANELLAQLQQANRELSEAREKEKVLAIAEERVRVARDLHDGLGHHLTALSIQLQAVEKLVRSNPDLAAEAARNARGEVQQALKEVRQSVAALREAPVDLNDLPQAIARLVEETGKRAGLQTSFRLEGEGPLSPAAALTLFRAAQEGLTNIQKHAAQAAQVQVTLAYSGNTAHLTIQNDGKSQPVSAGGGFGLAGLKERAALLGGSMECGPTPAGGFRLRISVPRQVNPISGEDE